MNKPNLNSPTPKAAATAPLPRRRNRTNPARPYPVTLNYPTVHPSTSNPHIVMVLPRGEAIRNFAYTGALDHLRQATTVSCVSVIPSNDLRSLLQESSHGLHELLEIPERWPVRFLRELLDMAHGRWLWSEAAKERWRLRDQEALAPAECTKRLAKKLLVTPLAHRSGVELLERIERLMSRSLCRTTHYRDLFLQIQPALVFNGSHVHSRNAVQAVQAAQWLRIPTATFIFSWDNLTSQGRVIPMYDYFLVWNTELRDQLLRLYPRVTADRVFVTGTPQFDCHFQQRFEWTRQEFCQKTGADPSRPIVLYATGMPNHMPGEERIVEDIADRLASMKEFGPPQLMVRVYAKDRSNRFASLRARRPDILFPEVPWEPHYLTPKLEDCYVWSNTVRHCDVGINVASTVSLEHCMFDKPVINVAYNPDNVPQSHLSYARYYSFDHYRPVVESGAVAVARSSDDLEQCVRNALQAPGAASPQRRALITRMFADSLDGKCGERVAKILTHLAKTTVSSSIQ